MELAFNHNFKILFLKSLLTQVLLYASLYSQYTKTINMLSTIINLKGLVGGLFQSSPANHRSGESRFDHQGLQQGHHYRR